MSSVWGNHLKVSLFGESHGPAIGVTIHGLPSGLLLDEAFIQKELSRRAPGQNEMTTARKETDCPEIISGLFKGYTTGTPLTAIFKNNNTIAKDYAELASCMRPGHADYTGYIRYHGFQDYRGGGHFSGRLTANLVFVGAICKQWLLQKGIYIGAHIASIDTHLDVSLAHTVVTQDAVQQWQSQELAFIDASLINPVKAAILAAKAEGDSLGGTVECGIFGIPAGLGDPFFDTVESRIAGLVFAVPAIKGISFGSGFALSTMRGSTANDSMVYEGDQVISNTNHNGGILGGITTGMPILFTAVVKPTPSIGKAQQTINVVSKETTTLSVKGRHDPCIVPRVVPVLEAVAAMAMVDILLGKDM